MLFKFSDDELALINEVRSFCISDVEPIAAEIDRNRRFPVETWEKLVKKGWTGIPFPKEYGGGEHTYLAYIVVCEELAKYCASTSVTVSAHHSLCCWPIFEYGTEEQKKKFLPPLLSGGKLGAFGATEPEAGSDAGNQKTIAVDKGDHWVITGNKIFITNGSVADTYVIAAMTDKSLGTRGISAFIVEKGTPGFSFGSKEDKMGIQGSATYELIFKDCAIPKENLLGELGKGFKVAMNTLNGGRIGIAAQAVGIAQGTMDRCIDYVTTHNYSDSEVLISSKQNTQFVLASLQTKIDAARLLLYRVAQAKEDGDDYIHSAAMAKLFSSEVAMEVATTCMEIVGDYGYSESLPFARYFRDAKITEIYEGTSEVQKMVISAWMGLK